MTECDADVRVHELPAGVYALLGEGTVATAAEATVVVLLNTPITDPLDRFARIWNTGLRFCFFLSLFFLRCCFSLSLSLSFANTKTNHCCCHRHGTATARVCADGASNRLLDAFGADAFATGTLALPHAIVGDLDSALPATLAFFRDRVCGSPLLLLLLKHAQRQT